MAFIACQSMTSQLMIDLGFKNLGFLNVALIYFFFSISSYYSDSIIKRVGYKVSLVVPAVIYCLWITTFIIPALRQRSDRGLPNGIEISDGAIVTIFIFSGSLVGLANGPYWVSALQYVTACSNRTNAGRYMSFLGVGFSLS